MVDYYRATDLPIPHTTADANRITRNLREIADSFARLPSPEALRDGLATYYTAVIGDIGDSNVSGGPATSEGVAGAVGGTASAGIGGTAAAGGAGEEDAWTVAPDEALPAQSDPAEPYEDEQAVRFTAPADNTGPVTVSVGGRDPVPVQNPDGSELASGDITAGDTVRIEYDAAETAFILTTTDTWRVTPDTPLPPQSDSNQPYEDGQVVTFPAPEATTGPVAVSVGGRPAVPVIKPDGSALDPGDISGGEEVTVHYDQGQGSFVLGSGDAADTWGIQPTAPIPASTTPGDPYTNGQILRFRVPVDTTGPVVISTPDRPDVPLLNTDHTPIEPGDLDAGTLIFVHYDASLDAFVVGIGSMAMAGETVWTVTPTQPLATPPDPNDPYVDGQVIRFRTPGPISGDAVIAIAGRSQVPLLNNDGSELAPGDLVEGSLVTVHYDSTRGAFVLGIDDVKVDAEVPAGSLTPDSLDADTESEKQAFRDTLGIVSSDAAQEDTLGAIDAPVVTVGVPRLSSRTAAFTLAAPVDFGPFPPGIGVFEPPTFMYLSTGTTQNEIGPLPGPASTVLGEHSVIHDHPEAFTGGELGQLPGGTGVAPYTRS